MTKSSPKSMEFYNVVALLISTTGISTLQIYDSRTVLLYLPHCLNGSPDGFAGFTYRLYSSF